MVYTLYYYYRCYRYLTYYYCNAQFEQYVPLERCYRVAEDMPEKQLCEVLKHFNVVVTQNDIFSRCQKCNYDEFVKVSKSSMDILLQT